MYYSWSRQSSAWTSCEWDELYLTSSGTDGLNIVEIFLLNERFPNSASVYFQHFLCPVLLAATSAKKHCEYKLQPKTLKNLWLLHSWGAGAVTVLTNCCKTLQVTAAKLKQAPFHSWKVDLCFIQQRLQATGWDTSENKAGLRISVTRPPFSSANLFPLFPLINELR